jgi:hypothetical protein
MDTKLTRRPDGVHLNALSTAVFDVLARFTAFPWPIMLAQCKRVNVDPSELTADGLRKALPFIVHGVERFTDPVKAGQAEEELSSLARM